MKVFAAFALLLSALVSTHSLAKESSSYSSVQVVYAVKSDTSKTGYAEKLSWTIDNEEDWNRFYNSIPGLPRDKTVNPDPIKNKVQEMFILSQKDTNRLTGVDIYVSPLGVAVGTRGIVSSYYNDSNKFLPFLEEEQKMRASFGSFLNKDINAKSFGIVTIYNINEKIPNPTWLIDRAEDITLYESFFKKMQPITDSDMNETQDKFNGLGTFVMLLNYPGAPADMATVFQGKVRLSKLKISTDYYQDKDDYFNFLKGQARSIMDYNDRMKTRGSADDGDKF